MTMPEWHPVPLPFEVTGDRGAPASQPVLTITSVERDDHAIRINYEIVPPLAPRGHFGPWGEAKDDVGNRYDDCGGAYGLHRDGDRTDGVLSFPLPAADATELLAHIDWNNVWEGRTVEVRVILRDR